MGRASSRCRCAVLSAFIAFYLGRVHREQGAELPEDRLDANIDDGDAELGFFSPWSWWPIMLAASPPSSSVSPSASGSRSSRCRSAS